MNLQRFITLFSIVLALGSFSAHASNQSAASVAVPGVAGGDIDPRVREYVMPVRVVWTGGKDVVENSESLLLKRSAQITLDSSNPCVLRTGGAVLLDFGKELHGGVQIMAWNNRNGNISNKPVSVRVRFGESVSEAMSDGLYQGKNPTNDHAVRDQETTIPWLGTAEIGNTGFRFVRIDYLGDGFLELKSVKAIFLYRPLEYKGSFRCNDERLNEIWKVGAYTVHLNMQDYLWDGIKRDRLVWIGDMHPETMTIQSVFGQQDIVKDSLDLIREETPLPRWMNGISSYSMWWLIIQSDYYKYTGDITFLSKQKDYITGLLNQLSSFVSDDGRETLPEMRFLDWPSQSNAEAKHAGLQALLIITLEKGAELCSILHEDNTRIKCLQTVKKLRTHIPDPAGSKQAAALLALANLASAEKMNREVMAVDGPKRMSTFYGYYVLQARAKAKDYQGSLDVIRQYWGGMLDMGATTFWEDFDLDWTENAAPIDEIVPEGKKDIHGDYGNYCYVGFRHSLCHGWASGPTAWLSENVLGVKPVEPGCKTVKIEPHLADLKWVEGTYPVPQGVIKVRHERQVDGTIKSKIEAPDGVKIVK